MVANGRTIRGKKTVKRAGAQRKLRILPRPDRAWLLGGTALVTGMLAAVVLPQGSALANCAANGVNTVYNCSGTFNTSGETFTPDNNFNVNVQGDGSAPADPANITGTGNAPVITVNTDGNNGTITVEEGAKITGRTSGSGSNRDGIRVNGSGDLTFNIDGTIIAADNAGLFNDEGVALQLSGNGNSKYTINIGETGVLGVEGDDNAVIAVSGGVQHTTINNYGTINGSLDFSSSAQGVTFNNYSDESWHFTGTTSFTNAGDLVNNQGDGFIESTGGLLSPAVIDFRAGDDTLRNRWGAVAEFNAASTTVFFSDGGDTLLNTQGAEFTTNNLSTFFFDDPNFFILPIPGTEDGQQYADRFENSKGATFTANGTTSFFFGGGDDVFENSQGAEFYANDLTLFNFGSGNDKFLNNRGAEFEANDGTLITMGSGDDEFVNDRGGDFYANGAVGITFGDGADEFTNDSDFHVNGITVVDFGNDLGDVAINDGYISVTGSLTFSRLESVTNYDFITLRNGSLGDSLNIGDPIFGTDSVDLVGRSWGEIGIDAFLGQDGGLLTGADQIRVSGDVLGQTNIVLNNTAPTARFNEAGITFMQQASGQTVEYNCEGAYCGTEDSVRFSQYQSGYIVIDGYTAIENGLFATFIRQEGNPGDAQNWDLVTQAGPGAINAAGIVTGAQTIFYDTLDVVSDHNYSFQFAPSGGGGADLPEAAVYEPAPAAAGQKTGLWAKATGSWTERDTNVTEGLVSYDTGSQQDTYSILGGADMKWDADSPFRLGVFGGYVTSSLDFDLGSVNADYEGGTVGVYGAYNNGAWYADVTVKGDFLSTDYSFGGVGVDADVTNVGVAANTGYRFTMGSSYVEPIASIAYVNSDVDDFTGGGGSVSFSNNDSFRAGAGARIGTTFAMGGGSTELSLLGKVWNEFEDANTVTVTDGFGTTASYSDDIEGIFGEVQGNVLFSNAGGTLSAFVGGGAKFNEDFTSWNAQVGVRTGF